MTKRLLTIGQAATELGIGRTKAFELASVGALRTVWIGRRRFVPSSEIDRVIEEGAR